MVGKVFSKEIFKLNLLDKNLTFKITKSVHTFIFRGLQLKFYRAQNVS